MRNRVSAVMGVAALLAGVATYATFTLRRPPTALLTLIDPAAERRIAMEGGVRLRYRGDDLELSELRALVDKVEPRLRAMGGEVTLAGRELIMDLPGRRDLAEVEAQAARPGGLTMQLVAEGPAAQDWQADAAARVRAAGVAGVRDYSFGFGRRGEVETTLIAEDRDLLERTLASAGVVAPPGFALGLEHVEPSTMDDDGNDQPDDPPASYWRTYLLELPVLLDGDDVASANIVSDAMMGRPEIMLEFTRAAGERFADLTERNVGRRLAISVGGTINSAPVIESRIGGGRARISMGGADPRKMLADAQATVVALRSGGLPVSLHLVDARLVEPWVSAALLPGVRLALALLAALVVLGLAVLARRLPQWTTPGADLGLRGQAPAPWGRLVVTLGAPLLTILAGRILVPGLDRDWLDEVLSLGGGNRRALSVVALGLTPVLTAFVLVEVAALLVPPWRKLRTGGRRMPLLLAALGLSALLAGLQGWLMTRWLVGLGYWGRDLLVGSPWLVVVTLVGGTFALLALAGVVTRHGLGSGIMVVLLGAGLAELHAVARSLLHAGAARLTLTLAGVAALALATTWLLSRRTAVQPQQRLPSSSLDALVLPQLVLALLGLAVLVGGVAPARVLEWLQPSRVEVLVVFALVAAAIAVGLGRAYTGRLDAAPVDVAFLALVLVVGYVLGKLAGLPALSIVIGTGWLLDVQAERRARLPDPVDVAELDDPQRGDLVLGTLAAAGIPAHLRGANVRTLLRFFAPFVTITVRVPRAQAAEAQRLLATLPA